MSVVFISHSSKDHSLTQEIKTRLSEQGYLSLFLDFDPEKGIKAGASWEQTLYRKLRACRAVIAVCTDSYLLSRWCFAEIALARMEGKPIFTLIADPLGERTELPSILSENQYVDLTKNKEEGYRRLWEGLEEAKIERAIDRSWNPNDPPYPGLLAFQEKDMPIFFGREGEIAKGLDLLSSKRRQNFVLTLGASGSGKSSLIRAGIVPRLRRDPNQWLVVGPFRPGQEPLEELAASLGETFKQDWEKIHQQLRKSKDLAKVARRYRRSTEQREATVLVVIDQFEELLGHSADHPSAKFLTLLRTALETEDSPILVLATMRSDFLELFQQNAFLQGVVFDSISLGTLPVHSMRTIIEEPARLGQIELESGLVDSLLQDTATADALPLLAFTLRKLWDDFRQDGLLTLREYETLGGLHGAIANEAEAVMKKVLKKWREEDLRSVFLKMVRINEDGGYSRRPIKWTDLPGANEMLKDFVDRRLLISPGDGTVSVAHEALFRAWGRFAVWLSEVKANLLLQQQISRAAQVWQQEEHADDLWRGPRLERARELLERGAISFDTLEKQFVEKSVQAETSRRSAAEMMRKYNDLLNSALRQYVHPYLKARRAKLIAEIEQYRHRAYQTTTADVRQLELYVVDNFLNGRGRWHPEKPIKIASLGPTDDYADIYKFKCCNLVVRGDEGSSGGVNGWAFGMGVPSQFRADGCQEAPIP